MKSAAQKDVRNNSDVTIPTINELREKIILLNKNQCLIFDDLAERIFAQNENADQFCVYIWVDRCEHLGHTLTCDGQMDQDAKEKFTQLVDSTVRTRETFRFAHPSEQIQAMEKYCLSLYGSNLWRLEPGGLTGET